MVTRRRRNRRRRRRRRGTTKIRKRKGVMKWEDDTDN